MFLFVIFCASLQTKQVDLQIFRQDVGVDGHGKQSTRHEIFSPGSRGGLGAQFWGKISPLKCMAKMVTPLILETVHPRAKRCRPSPPHWGEH